MPLATLLVAAAFAAVHLFAGRLRFISLLPRSRYLSAAGGVGVAYVFVHLLPELAEYQEHVGGHFEDGSPLARVEVHVYLLALVGLIAFYGLDRLAVRTRRGGDGGDGDGDAHPEAGVFWLHVATFALYNGLIGYLLLHREPADAGTRGLVVYAVAIGLHFVTNDFGLHQHFPARYRRVGRFVLAAAVLLGWLVGYLGPSPDPLLVGALFGLLAGGIVLNTLKEELPEERDSSFWAFLLGSLAFGGLLLLI